MWKLNDSDVVNFLATSPKATLTGLGFDMVVIDDLVRDAYEAHHRTILDDHFKWFSDTLYSRLEGRAKVILIMTRWSLYDLTGQICEMFEKQGRRMRILSKPAMDDKGNLLCEHILSEARYRQIQQTVGLEIFEANYNQRPLEATGRLYGDFLTHKYNLFSDVRAVCDYADTGHDYLCLLIFGVKEMDAYILDIYYTRESSEVTEREVARRLASFGVRRALFETNGGGRIFMANVRRHTQEMSNNNILFKGFDQYKNKMARIHAFATEVIRRVRMPEDWEVRFPAFFRDVRDFIRGGQGQPDDGPDALTIIVERALKENTKLIG
jgi:predicted phage terminase large subunit-like protein